MDEGGVMDDFDFALVMSAYVEYHTTHPGDGSYIPMTEEEASEKFLSFVNQLQAEAWNEGFTAGSDYVSELEVGSGSFELAESLARNPYRSGK